MAKRPSKRKKKCDPLCVSLNLLAKVDKESYRAVCAMGKAIQLPVDKIRFKNCRFKLNGELYAARVTLYHCEVILGAVTEKSNVFLAVTQLLSKLNYTVACGFQDLTELLDPTDEMLKQTAPLGCCTCDSGQVANLTQAQCSQFSPSTWTQPPDCTGQPP